MIMKYESFEHIPKLKWNETRIAAMASMPLERKLTFQNVELEKQFQLFF